VQQPSQPGAQQRRRDLGRILRHLVTEME
jgi:hypothetical protein